MDYVRHPWRAPCPARAAMTKCRSYSSLPENQKRKRAYGSHDRYQKRLWSSADNLRANSNYASNEYFLPVMGLIFLRHAFSRFERVKARR